MISIEIELYNKQNSQLEVLAVKAAQGVTRGTTLHDCLEGVLSMLQLC